MKEILSHVVATLKRTNPQFIVEEMLVTKQNGKLLHGVMIKEGAENIAPIIYIDQMVEDNLPVNEIAERVWKAYLKSGEIAVFDDLEMLTDWGKMKDYVRIRILNTDMNSDYLSDTPKKEILNFSIYLIIEVADATIKLSQEILNKLEVDFETVYEQAFENTRKQVDIKSMDEIFCDLFNGQVETTPDLKMLVLSNNKHIGGAASMLVPEALEYIMEKMGAKCLYMLPSSIHEVLLINGDGDYDPDALREMVESINQTQLEPAEILANNVYRYEKGTWSIAA